MAVRRLAYSVFPRVHSCVSIGSARLAIAGDFVKGSASPIEGAILSGIAAAESIATAVGK